jgi:DNA-binding MarR family transcriptional regulator
MVNDALEAEDNGDWPPARPSDRRPPVWQSVHGAYHAMRFRLRHALADQGLEPSEASVLVHLLTSPGASPGEIRRTLGLHRSTLSSMLDRLERRGYIQRGAPHFDGRRLIIDLTPAGTVAASRTRHVLLDVEEELDGWVAPHERRGAAAVFAACQALMPFDEWVGD